MKELYSYPLVRTMSKGGLVVKGVVGSVHCINIMVCVHECEWRYVLKYFLTNLG